MKLLKKWSKALRSRKGYTLIEVAAVVAVTATLGAVVIPIVIDKAQEAKVVAAREGTKAIGLAITAFYKDTGHWPAAGSGSGSGTAFYNVLRSGGESGSLGVATHDPRNASSVWSGTGVVTTNVDNLDNHLVRDNPGGTYADTTAQNNTYLNSLKLNWKGPYAESFGRADPLGNNYLVYVTAMRTPSTGVTKQYGWIISAGPNAALETKVTDSALKGDDIGYALYSAETGR